MRAAKNIFLVLVTAPNIKTARRLAKLCLERRLAACANLAPGLESHYWWQGRLEAGAEVLMLIKTTRARLGELERLLLKEHPYDTPEIIALPVTAGTPAYLDWLSESAHTQAPYS